MTETGINAEVISVFPNKVRVAIDRLEDFRLADEALKVGSYLRISDNDDAKLFAIIETFSIEVSTDGQRKYLIEANPIGLMKDGRFTRGGDTIAIPPKKVEPASDLEIQAIYADSVRSSERFEFCSLATRPGIRIPVDGNRFFSKHVAIVGSTGSGKSHTVATLLQKAVESKSGQFELNNSHIVVFDIHSEYRAAFPNANHIDIKNLVLPYWMLTGEELEELFLDTDSHDHNQRHIFRTAVVDSRRANFRGTDQDKANVHFDSPLPFRIRDVLTVANEKNTETIDSGEVYASGAKKGQPKTSQGSLYGKLTNFINRLESKVNDKRMSFLLGSAAEAATIEQTLSQLLGYDEKAKANVTVIDLSGVPFDVLSITVALISRILFEYGYFYKRILERRDATGRTETDIPILLVFEEAHKYVPNSEHSRHRAAKVSIERIAKEGRKYGVTLLLASQRPSEISETIFSQCNNFLAMRLTNPNDQSYVKRLLPDSLGDLIESMPNFKAGEALLTGDAVILPSIVRMDVCAAPPSSHDIPYLSIWREAWKDVDFAEIRKDWSSR